MKTTNASIELFPAITRENLLKHIERCGRVCYKSEDKITDGSAEKFIGNIINRGHYAVLEHGNLIFELGPESVRAFDTVMHLYNEIALSYDEGSYKKISPCFLRYDHNCDAKHKYIVSGNVRAFIEFFNTLPEIITQEGIDTMGMIFRTNEFPEFFGNMNINPENADIRVSPGKLIWDEDELTEAQKYTHVQRTIRFICDRGVSHEIVRHRPASYCQESTRYCNYGKDQFGNEITVIEPSYLTAGTPAYKAWEAAMQAAEVGYFMMLDAGCSAQEARAVLPNSLKTEICMSANLREWHHFFKLRTAPAAHPQMREVAQMAYDAMNLVYSETFGDIAKGE